MSLEHLMLYDSSASPLDVSLSAFLLDREAARCTAKTLEHYQYTCGGFVAFLEAAGIRDVQGITPHLIRSYLVSLQRRGLKDTTQHAHARGIKAWMNWLVGEGVLDASPMRRIKMPRLEKRVPALFAPNDIHVLLDQCDQATATGARNNAIVALLLDTGLRAGELISLRIGHVDMRSGLTSVFGKGGKQRQIRVGRKARSTLLRMLAYRDGLASGSALWMGYDAQGRERGPLTVSGLQTVLRRLGARAGVKPCAPHRFRRTFALWMLRDGCDLHSLRMLMGHSSLDVLQRYLALAGEDIERAHIAHSPVDKLLNGM